MKRLASFAVALLSVASLASGADGPANDIDLSVVPAERFTGEPYALAGNRIVFTSWYFVRPGGYAWKDEKGETVTVTRQRVVGPEEAHFERKWDAPRGVRLVARKPERRGPVLRPEKPWEGHGISVRQVLKDGEKYRAWGGVEDGDGKVHTAYYESRDGVQWDRPVLGRVEYGGNKENNLVEDFPGNVFVDPTASAEERYKSVGGEVEISFAEFKTFAARHPNRWEPRALRADRKMERPILSLHGFVSADGLAWRKLPEPFAVEHSDTQVVAGYDAGRKKYFIYTRNYFVGPRAVGAPADTNSLSWLGDANGSGRRSIGYTESDRFADFPLSQLVLAPRSDMGPSQVLYTNCYTTVPGAPDQHLLFPSVWDTTTDSTHLEVAASHDGRVWNWVPGGPVMETQAFGEFDGGCIFWCPNLIELPNGDFALPYTGYALPHKYPRKDWRFGWGFAVWPKGRLVALEAPGEGEFTTVGLLAPGRELRVNALTARAGSVRVAVTTRDGKVLPGRSFEDCVPIVGDRPDVKVEWAGENAGSDLGYADGPPICLRFKMDRASIYGLQFR